MTEQRDWWEMETFRSVDLENCHVLGWRHDSQSRRLVFFLDVMLLPDHPSWSRPGPGERGCYKKAMLSFEGLEAAQGLPRQDDIRPYEDADGACDYGDLTDLRQEAQGVFRFYQDFSDIRVRCESLRFEVSD